MSGIINSLRKNKVGIIIMVFSAFATAIGQYCWKISHLQSLNYQLIFLLIGFICYGFGALCMIVAFKFGSFSVLHPMQSLGYVFAVIIGYFMLNEAITTTKLIGLLFILFGVTMIGAGDE